MSAFSSEEQAVRKNDCDAGAPCVSAGRAVPALAWVCATASARVYQGSSPATSSTVHATDRANPAGAM